MDRLYVGFLIGFVLGVWISFIVVVIAVRSTRRNQAPARSTTQSQPQQDYRAEPATVAPKSGAAASSPAATTPSSRPPASFRAAAQANPTTQQLYHRLIGMNFGDEAVTNRQIDYERQRAPRESLGAWIQNAMDQLARDRR